MKSKRKFNDPFTPRTIAGMTHMYARYEPKTDSVELWAYSGKSEDIIDADDGDWGLWSMREKIVSRRNKNGEWIEELNCYWIPE